MKSLGKALSTWVLTSVFFRKCAIAPGSSGGQTSAWDVNRRVKSKLRAEWRKIFIALAAALLLACGAIPPTGTGGTGGTGGGDGALCPETCAEAAAVQPSTSENWPCSLEPLCGRVSFSTPPSLVIGPPYTLRTPIEARCTLEALRDGKQGYLFWSAVSNGGPGVSDSWHLFIRPGRIALVKKESYSDFRSEHWLGARKLQDAAYFTDCLSKTGDALYSCFSGAAAPACE